jgi:hypothetical protein
MKITDEYVHHYYVKQSDIYKLIKFNISECITLPCSEVLFLKKFYKPNQI